MLLDWFIDRWLRIPGAYGFTLRVYVLAQETLEIRRRTLGMENLETLVAAHNLVPCCGEEKNFNATPPASGREGGGNKGTGGRKGPKTGRKGLWGEGGKSR